MNTCAIGLAAAASSDSIVAMLQAHPEGILSSQFRPLYRRAFGVDLMDKCPPTTKLLHLLSLLPDAVRIEQLPPPSRDFRVLPLQSPLPLSPPVVRGTLACNKPWLAEQFKTDDTVALPNGSFLIERAYLSSGNRGVVYLAWTSADGTSKHLRVVSKEPLPSRKRGQEFIDTDVIRREGENLVAANGLSIGPTLRYRDRHRVVMDFVPGPRILDAMRARSRESCGKIVCSVLRQLHALDMAGMDKGENNRPERQVLVDDDDAAVLIDFERMRYRDDAKNVKQFCFISRLDVVTYQASSSRLLASSTSFDQKVLVLSRLTVQVLRSP